MTGLPPKPNFQPGPSAPSSNRRVQSSSNPPLPQFPHSGYPWPIPTYPPQHSFGQSLFTSHRSVPAYIPNAYSSNVGASYVKRPRVNNGQNRSGGGVKAWRNCSFPGCKFVGSGEDVEVHEGDRHLIFRNGPKVERSEEEERFAKRNGPNPVIQGTNITLETQEDIEKWIAERKNKWPSAQRVAEKQEERRAAIERGETPGRGRGRGGGRGMGKRARDPAAMAEDWGRPVDSSSSHSRGEAFRGRGRGRERGRGNRGGRGRGTWKGGYHGDNEDHTAQNNPQLPQTSILSSSSITPSQAPSVSTSGQTITSLAALGDYDSDDSDSSSTTSDSSSDSDSGSDTSDSESNATVIKEEVVILEEPKANAPTKRICKFFAKSGRCKHGDKCHFAHIKPDPGSMTKGPVKHRGAGLPRQPQQKKVNPFERPSMLGALLATPIQNTVSQLSQTIRFLVANDMLEGVELKPGQAEEEEKKRNMIKVIDSQTEVEGESEESPLPK
ncbi:hypothetical protein TREMEDRAFT_67022 [Tremella mesenterica DSM 1558]|uniref:uncharacterized protein n=1 Tax=Tremella mesenterica (strain ATCC 24925 / CBS 8224 / DSM 1558 / NBRC 9311 / NRRL Y-6157 / RJB 2259-6 / UBC 559-6) TaxID=578456 RepID=UPI0003F49941|nr:uncharacterized protein TREMEDRAFT_67022 [Tremella mesenterica DSM 1558]EIW72721.1 hypothetical protein TREMEDRAFT_67022 [Tremella mesenterica DSM 1558]